MFIRAPLEASGVMFARGGGLGQAQGWQKGIMRHLGSSSMRCVIWDLMKPLLMIGGELYVPIFQTDEVHLCHLITLGISQVVG
jgi:hypothetical protein